MEDRGERHCSEGGESCILVSTLLGINRFLTSHCSASCRPSNHLHSMSSLPDDKYATPSNQSTTQRTELQGVPISLRTSILDTALKTALTEGVIGEDDLTTLKLEYQASCKTDLLRYVDDLTAKSQAHSAATNTVVPPSTVDSADTAKQRFGPERSKKQ
jgi:hypothetical protein